MKIHSPIGGHLQGVVPANADSLVVPLSPATSLAKQDSGQGARRSIQVGGEASYVEYRRRYNFGKATRKYYR